MLFAAGGVSTLRRIVTAAALVGLAALVMLGNGGFRDLEAQGASYLTQRLTGTDTLFWEGHQVFVWSLGTPQARGLFVTPDCSAAFIAGPLLLVAAVVCVGRRLRLGRILYASALAATVVVVVNIGRISMIAWAIHEWGPRTGFWWSHVVAGSIVTLAGAVLGLWVLVWTGFRQEPVGDGGALG